MRNAWGIFAHELKRLTHSPLAILVVIGIIVLPAVCAWCAIASAGDPASPNSGLKVAIVNADEGVAISSLDADKEDLAELSRKLGGAKDLNIGNLVIDAMSEADGFDWQFVDAEQGENGLASGEYYAEFVLPAGFTKDFLDVLSGEIDQPTVEYRVSQRHGATAYESVDPGTGLVDSVVNQAFAKLASESFADVVKGAVSSLASAGAYAGTSSKTGLPGAASDLATVRAGMKHASSSIGKWRDTVLEARDKLDALKASVPSLQDALDDSQKVLSDVRTTEHEVSNTYSSALAQGGKELTSVLNDAADRVSKAASAITEKQSDVDDALANAKKALSESQRLIEALRKVDPGSSTVADLEKQNKKLQDEIDDLEKASKAVSDAASKADDAASSLSQDFEKAIDGMKGRNNSFNSDTMPKLNLALDSIALAMGSLAGALSSLEAQADQAKVLIEQLDGVLQKTADAIGSADESLESASEGISSARSDLAALVNSKAIKQVSKITGADTGASGSSLSPVSINVKQAYPLSSYGAGIAPFCAALAIWVGCLMLILLVKPETELEGFPAIRPWQAYLGRLLLFIVLALLQAIVVIAGTLLVGAQVFGPVSLVVAGVFAAFCFISIVYALDATFPHIGKALAVVLLIVQIPIVSGAYPVDLMPDVEQGVRTWLPIAYGVDAMREAISGFNGSAYLQCLAWLAACGLATLALAFFVRPRALKLGRSVGRRLAMADVFVVGADDLSDVDVAPEPEKKAVFGAIKEKLSHIKPVREDAGVSVERPASDEDAPVNFTEVVWDRDEEGADE